MTNTQTTCGFRAIGAALTITLGLMLMTGCGGNASGPGGGENNGGATDDGAPTTYTIHLEGMMCDGCEQAVTAAAQSVEGTTVVGCDWETGELVVAAPESARNQIEAAVSTIDYRVVSAGDAAGNEGTTNSGSGVDGNAGH